MSNQTLSVRNILDDPLIKLMMKADGVDASALAFLLDAVGSRMREQMPSRAGADSYFCPPQLLPVDDGGAF